MSERKPLRVALGEYDTGWHDPEGSLRSAGEVIARAAGAGAELVVLPETATTGFTMETARWAEPLEGPSVAALARLAEQHRVHLIAGAAISGDGGVHNTALHLTPDGGLAASYRKQRLFAYAGED